MLCNAFNDRSIFENMAFVFTKFYGKRKKQEKKYLLDFLIT